MILITMELKKVSMKPLNCSENKQEIKEINLSISSGESVYIQGEDRQALNCLIMLIGLVIKPDKGSIFVDSMDTSVASAKERAALRNMYFGYIGDCFPLIDNWSVMKNVEIPLIYSKEKLNPNERRSNVRRFLEAVLLSDKARDKVGTLTRAEKLRVQIARAFVNNGEIILADIPVMNLEHNEQEQIMELIFQLSEGKKTIVMTGLDSGHSQRFSQRVMLKDGILLQEYWGKSNETGDRAYAVFDSI